MLGRRWSCYVSRSTCPVVNMEIEDYLLRSTSSQLKTSNALFLWRNRPCIVIGRNQNPWTECHLQSMKQDSVPLIRRQSGGGTVYHDFGNTNYTIVMPRSQFDKARSSQLISSALTRHLDVPASVNQRNDIVIKHQSEGMELKVSGSAYRLIKDRAFHHGTMLIHSDLALLERYLHFPKVPLNDIKSRALKSVRSRVTKLTDWSSTVDHMSFCQSVIMEVLRNQDAPAIDLPPSFEYIEHDTHFKYIDSVKDLLGSSSPSEENYLNGDFRRQMESFDWLYGQTPDFSVSISLEDILHENGSQIHLEIHRAQINDVKYTGPDEIIGQKLNQLLIGCRYQSDDVRSLIARLDDGDNDNVMKSILHKLADQYIII